MPKNGYSVGRIGTFSLPARTVSKPRHEVIEGPWNEDCDLPVHIEPGEYEAVSVRHSFRKIFNKHRVVAEFRITEPGPGFGAMLDCYWVVQSTSKGRWTIRKQSKLARDIARLFPWFRRPRIAIQGSLQELLKGKLFLVKVVTVTHDHKQRELEQGYSKIESIVRVLQGD
jgi:hypothetical protein